MIQLIDTQHQAGVPQNAGTLALSRKGGTNRLFLKSPLLEDYFRTLSKGEITPKPDRVFGVNLYRIPVDASIEEEFLRDAGVVFSEASQFYGSSGGSRPWFNISFIRAVGAGEGIHFPIHSMLPAKLVEDGSFARAMRQGISKLLKEFICDFETELSFTYTSRS